MRWRKDARGGTPEDRPLGPEKRAEREAVPGVCLRDAAEDRKAASREAAEKPSATPQVKFSRISCTPMPRIYA
jgi:hypothetical protein